MQSNVHEDEKIMQSTEAGPVGTFPAKFHSSHFHTYIQYMENV